MTQKPRPTRPGVDILLADGSSARVRQIGPQDADAIVRLHAGLSERTRYLRYFAAYPRIRPRDLERMINVDHREREAFVVELGGEIIATGQYIRLGPDSPDAEVAFLVTDGYQRRGLGSVLIEHLAAAAREEGIANFVADVLPVNATMLRVFTDAGYPVERRYADGNVRISFPIAPTPESLAVQRSREHHAETASIARLLAPRGVAVYGVRADGTGVGAAMLSHLRAGFTGPIRVVHPTATEVCGLPARPTLVGVDEPIDLAIVAVPADAVPAVVADCAAAGVHGLVVVSVGFAESGPDGARAQTRLVRQVRGHGMRLIGPNCFGVANTNPSVRLNATLSPRLPAHGPVGFFSQSAALGVALLAEAGHRGLALSSFVSAGNRADVSGNDLLQYWRDDPDTSMVLLYMETFGNPRKFTRIARELTARKPVVAVASTVRPPALRAVAAGPDERGVAALFASSGVIRVDTVRELFDVGLVLAYQPLPCGSRLAIVTNAAALGALAAGAAPAAGLVMAAGYPRDLGLTATAAGFGGAVAEALADPGVDMVVAAYAPAFAEDGDSVAPVAEGLAQIVASRAAEASDSTRADGGSGGEAARVARPVVAVFPVRSSAARRLRCCGTITVPTYASVEEAVRALGLVAGYAAWRREPAGTVPVLPDINATRARGIVAELAVSAKGQRSEAGEADALLACYGIRVVPSRLLTCPAEGVAEAAAEVGFPVALKVARAPWRHRIDLGAVRLDLASRREVYRAFNELCRLFGAGVEVLVQPMVPPGVACVVEAVDDPSFGPVVGFGLGGVASDLLGDRAWRPAPLTDVDAAALVRAPRAAPLLMGQYGGTKVDLDALSDLLLRVGRLTDEHPRLRRLSLNPVLAYPEGLSVLHATVRIGAQSVRPDTGPRRLF